MKQFLHCLLSLLMLVSVPRMLPAQDIPGYPSIEAYDPREMALLPQYCKYTFYFREKVPGGNDTSAMEGWIGVLGPTFHHIHHYCFGLMKTNRAVLLARSEQVRAGYLTDSLHEFDYVLERAAPDFVLLPEILTKKGENLVRMNKGPLATIEFERAVEIKPDYWLAYAQLSDYYKGVGMKQEARDALNRGLATAPGTPALTRRLAELGPSKESSAATTKSKPAR